MIIKYQQFISEFNKLRMGYYSYIRIGQKFEIYNQLDDKIYLNKIKNNISKNM